MPSPLYPRRPAPAARPPACHAPPRRLRTRRPSAALCGDKGDPPARARERTHMAGRAEAAPCPARPGPARARPSPGSRPRRDGAGRRGAAARPTRPLRGWALNTRCAHCSPHLGSLEGAVPGTTLPARLPAQKLACTPRDAARPRPRPTPRVRRASP
ncbi:MAG: hypothetical protein J3K34DRAFT_407720 [Monoraphidium minutum]|nr:MAG: hypothetical protein J3K34DRAFT_407720 [Monoraphidium minutum]